MVLAAEDFTPSSEVASSTDTECFLAWVEERLSNDEALATLDPLIGRLARWAGYRYRLSPDLIEDCHQELATMLLVKARYQYDPGYGVGIGTFLSGYARRIGAHVAREAGRELCVDAFYDETLAQAGEAPWMSGDGLIAPSPETLLEREAHGVISEKRRQALQAQTHAIDQALAAIDVPGASQAKQNPRRQDTNAAKLKAMPSGQRDGAAIETKPKINMRLRMARRAMGLTRQQMAEALGMPLWRYTKYESGQSSPVPASVYEQVKALDANLSYRRRITEAFAGYRMSEIVAHWTSLLVKAGCPAGPNDVRDALGISTRTMQRWSCDYYRPKENIVVCHHEKLEEFLKAHAPHLRTLPQR